MNFFRHYQKYTHLHHGVALLAKVSMNAGVRSYVKCDYTGWWPGSGLPSSRTRTTLILLFHIAPLLPKKKMEEQDEGS